MKLEESRAYLACTRLEGGHCGSQQANQLGPIRFTGKTAPRKAQSLQAYKEGTNASMTFATLTGQWPMGGINFYLQTSKDFLVI
jgi:hypothetical protein